MKTKNIFLHSATKMIFQYDDKKLWSKTKDENKKYISALCHKNEDFSFPHFHHQQFTYCHLCSASVLKMWAKGE